MLESMVEELYDSEQNHDLATGMLFVFIQIQLRIHIPIITSLCTSSHYVGIVHVAPFRQCRVAYLVSEKGHC
jgi:hypothetical protein